MHPGQVRPVQEGNQSAPSDTPHPVSCIARNQTEERPAFFHQEPDSPEGVGQCTLAEAAVCGVEKAGFFMRITEGSAAAGQIPEYTARPPPVSVSRSWVKSCPSRDPPHLGGGLCCRDRGLRDKGRCRSLHDTLRNSLRCNSYINLQKNQKRYRVQRPMGSDRH